ncbi:MAG: hypothetical protein Rpha_0706 [Candidatus Ruthia sp. Apha_13_S6]|nr:hypothetical protein [Candidatus Ruthia sp. Apha_13_S6]
MASKIKTTLHWWLNGVSGDGGCNIFPFVYPVGFGVVKWSENG